MAGLLYLPRLFVYHAERAAPGGELAETFETMERRLLRGIMSPAMTATWVFGSLLALTPGDRRLERDGWIYVKLAAVAGADRGSTTGSPAGGRTSRRGENRVSGRT